MTFHRTADTGVQIAQDGIYDRIALLMCAGKNNKAIMAELNAEGLGPFKQAEVTRMMSNDSVKFRVRQLRDEWLAEAKATVRRRAGDLAEKVMDVLEHHIKNKNLNAVPYVFKALAIDAETETNKSDTNITVVMPGGETTSPKKIDTFTIEE